MVTRTSYPQQSSRALIVADGDGDGKPDLVVADSGSNDVSILSNECPPPDLIVQKTHTGDFTQGQTGATYTITVANDGTGPTIGTVGVEDYLPSGLTATAIIGAGWDCTLSPLGCTRSDVLPGGGCRRSQWSSMSPPMRRHR